MEAKYIKCFFLRIVICLSLVLLISCEKDKVDGLCTVTFDANGGTGTMKKQGAWVVNSIYLSACEFTREGYLFINWNTKADGSGTSLYNGQNIEISESMTLYAQWGKSVYLHFEANGAIGSMPDQTFIQNRYNKIKINTFTRSSYIFAGWNTKADGSGTSFYNGQNIVISESMTLYAQWNTCFFKDGRDGNTYKMVNIGEQIWMAENLRYLPSVNYVGSGSNSSKCYYVYGYDGTNVTTAKKKANYTTYGVLYNWPAAMSACPSGWHLPTDAEWNELTNYLGSNAGGKMKEVGTYHWHSPNEGATNESGFSALPGGYRSSNGSFNYLGYSGYWWTATECRSDFAWSRGLYYGNADVGRYDGSKYSGFSVRCLRD